MLPVLAVLPLLTVGWGIPKGEEAKAG